MNDKREQFSMKFQCENVVKTMSFSCSRSWDSLLCWPETNFGTVAELPCFKELNGIKYDTTKNASRYCHINGLWDNSNYSGCEHVNSDLYRHENEITIMIYLVGNSISLISLLIAVWILLHFKELRCLRNVIHANLFWTYISTNTVWILTFIVQQLFENNMFSCLVLMVLLHYFHLTTFFWMFVEGLYLYILVIKTFSGPMIRIKHYLIIGWGLIFDCTPLVFILPWVSLKNGLSSNQMLYTESGDTDNEYWPNCSWMTPSRYDLIYQIPVIVILLINLVFLITIMWVLIVKLRTSNIEQQQYQKAAKALLILIPLLGITYVLVLYGPEDNINWKWAFENVRAVLLSLQGAIIGVFYCFLNNEVQQTVKERMKTWKAIKMLQRIRNHNMKENSLKSRTESFRLTEHPLISTPPQFD